MELNERQKEAVEYLEGPLLVLAGPGTGKTQLLSQKVAYILRETDTNPENILCLTFTETGAANMIERLRSLIGPAGAKVNIGTYHSFGQNILTQYKNYTTNYTRNLDAAIDEVKRFKIVETIRDHLPATDILRGDNVKVLISTISSAKAAGLSAEDLAKIAEKNIEDSAVLSNLVAVALEILPPRGKYPETLDTVYRPIFEILEKYETAAPILKNIERSVVAIVRDLKGAILDAEAAEAIKPLTAWRDKYFERDEAKRYRLKDRVQNKKLASLAVVMAEYQKYLEERGLMDFDDMIQEAIRALRDDLGFRQTLTERYQYIMLDEFQDTNPSQLQIVKYLTDYEKPTIMAVGDDDQAIYEFQGALATNLSDFRDYYGAKVVALTENYRSTQEILDFSTKIIQQADDRFEKNKTLVARNPRFASLSGSQIERHEFASSDAEYGFVADRIAELVRSGVRQSEIAILSYKTKYFEPLLNALKEHPEIKIAYEKRDNLLEDVKIQQILTISWVVLDIAEEKRMNPAIFEVLSYPFFEIPVEEVSRVLGDARKDKKPILEAIFERGGEKMRAASEFLTGMVREVKVRSFEEMVWRIVEKMRIDRLAPEEQFEFYENLAALKSKLAKYCGEKTSRLMDFVQMVADYESAEMMITVSSPYREADDAVQILTAHKAKGLEFEYVFMISVDNRAWGKSDGNNNTTVLPKNLQQIRHTGTTDGEKLRILYVAMTRAKSHLIMTNSLRDFDEKAPKRLEYLNESVQKNAETGADEVISPFLPTLRVDLDHDEGAVEISEKQGSERFSRSLRDLKNWVKPYVANPNLRAIYQERVKGYKMSATGLTSFVDIIYAGPEAFFRQYLLGEPKEAVGAAAQLGTLVHGVFEAVTKEGISEEEAKKRFAGAVAEMNATDEEKKDLLERGVPCIEKSLEKFGEILRQGQAEVNFERDNIAVEGVPIVGRIDHLAIDEEAKTIEIYDFKTSKYYKDKWGSKAPLYKYRLQLGFYKLLLNNSPAYRDYTVTRAHILYVAPDKDGQVYDKVYEFNPEDEAELVRLLKAVYYQITSLAFLDDPELLIPADKGLELKDMLAFIELMLAKSGENC